MKLNWGFGIVLAFIGFIGFILYFVIIASTDQKAEHNLVTDEYYQEELKYQEEINALENAKNLNVRFNFEQTTEGLRIIIPETVRQQKSEGTVSLYRPSNKQLDFDLAISLSNSHLLIPDNRLLGGRWDIKIRWKHLDKDYLVKESITY